VLQRIAARSDLAIDITITTLRRRLARMLEPRAPRPDLRLATVRRLTKAGLAVGISASPLIPGITDREGDLEAVAAAGKEAGAQWFFSGVLFLRSEEHTSELQSPYDLVCRLLLEKKNKKIKYSN